MKNVLLYVWQLPQNLLGLLVILFTGAKRKSCYWITLKYSFGVSLGKYIIFGGYPFEDSIKHEQGHQKQSLYLGWLYLLIVGLPSFIGNIYDRVAHRKWSVIDRVTWYYNRFPENWADKLGGVKRV